MKYFSVIPIISLEYILKFRTTFHRIRIQVIIACICTNKNFIPSFPFDDCVGYTLGMSEEDSCIVIRMSNPTNSSFYLLEFMIDFYFYSIEFGSEVSKASPIFFILF